MAAQRVAMRNIKECLRLKFEAGLSHEKIARALQLSKGVVSKYVLAASRTGLDWPVLAALDEAALAVALLPAPKAPRRAVSGCCRMCSACTASYGARASPCSCCGRNT